MFRLRVFSSLMRSHCQSNTENSGKVVRKAFLKAISKSAMTLWGDEVGCNVLSCLSNSIPAVEREFSPVGEITGIES
jgi:hypothetical protein